MKKYYFFSIILFILLGSFQSIAKSPPPGTGTSDIPANILILLDKSGSMDWDASGNTTNVQYPIDVAVDPNTQNIFVSEIIIFYL